MKSVEQQQELWPEWAVEAKPTTSEHWRDLLVGFAHWMTRWARPIWDGVIGQEFDRVAHERARQSLCAKAPSASAEAMLADWWDRLIAEGNRLGRWSIELLPPIVRLPSVRPMFVRRDFQLLRELRACEAVLLRRLTAGVDDDQLPDAVLCSALVWGGIVTTTGLTALTAVKAVDLAAHDGHLRVMLPAVQGRRSVISRRWYPDALTATLLVRTLGKNRLAPAVTQLVLDEPAIFARLRRAFKTLNLPEVGTSGQDTLRAARVALSLHLTPYVNAYLSDDLASRSLPDSVLRHLNGWRSPEPDGKAAETPTEKRFQGYCPLDVSYDPGHKPVDQLRVIRKIYTILRKDEDVIRKLDKQLREHGSSLWPITALLIEWTKWLVGGHGQPSPVRASSARRYLGAVARHLIDVAEVEAVLDMDPEDFETLYELAATHVRSPKEKPVFWSCVRSFHEFTYLCGAPEIDVRELDGYVGDNKGSVSANLVGESDFATFKAAILGDCADSELESRQNVFLASMLGYRCGLRRREVQMLWLHDIHPGEDPYLIVRPSSLATLKSHSSQRRIPLKPLVPPDELSLLLNLAERRKAALGNYKGLLFASLHEPRVPPVAASLFDPVTQAFQKITGIGEPSFRFHHLRHSFANWLLLALLAADQPGLIDRRLGMFSAWLLNPTRVGALKQAFFPRSTGTPPAPTRRNLYLVSALLGHLSPETTLKSYVHVMDWLAGPECDRALEERIGRPGAVALGAICGLSYSMPHKAPYRELIEEPIRFFRRFVALRLPKANQETIASARDPVDLTPVLATIGKVQLPHPVTMMIFLGRMMIGVRPDDIERRHSIPQVALERARNDYCRMYAKQSGQSLSSRAPLPNPPRPLEQRREFWRIIDATWHAFGSVTNRAAMAAAAKVLIRRNGPNTGRTYHGRSPEDVLAVFTGLMCMGLEANHIRLVVRNSHSGDARTLTEGAVMRAAQKAGIQVVEEELQWPKRRTKRQLFRLDVLFESDEANNKRAALRLGRIRGVNYASVWISFAMTLMGQDSCGIALN